MILVCPLCHSRYLIAASLFANGPRQVRCAKCAHSWQADAPNQIDVIAVPLPSSPPASPAPVSPPLKASPAMQSKEHEADKVTPDSSAPTDPDQPPIPPPLPPLPSSHAPALIKRSLKKRLLAIFGALGLLLVLLALFFALAHGILISRWPFLEPIYDAIGIHKNIAGNGLLLEDVKSELQYEDGVMRLAVSGQIRNPTEKEQIIPAIMASAIGGDGQEIQSWQIDAPAAKLAPGDRLAFQSAINAPKGAIANIDLNFVERDNDHDK